MDAELLQLAIKSLSAELQEIKRDNTVIRNELAQLKKALNSDNQLVKPESKNDSKSADELISIQVARKIMNISRNTFLALVRDGLIKPIRLNLRTIRYSRVEIQNYIQRLH